MVIFGCSAGLDEGRKGSFEGSRRRSRLGTVAASVVEGVEVWVEGEVVAMVDVIRRRHLEGLSDRT